MEHVILEKQPPMVQVDAATHATLDEAEAELARGEFVSLEQAKINLEKQINAWRETKENFVNV